MRCSCRHDRRVHLDDDLDREIERSRDEAAVFRLRGKLAHLGLRSGLGLDRKPQLETREAEPPVVASAADTVAVHVQRRIGEPGTSGNPGEGDGEAGRSRQPMVVRAGGSVMPWPSKYCL